MLTYSFEKKGKMSLYEALYKYIKDDILSGKLKSGDALPSKRAFAKNLGISTITIENAYEQLIAEGYIYSLPKKGYYISDIAEHINTHKPKEENIISGQNQSYSYKYDLTNNMTIADNFPFYTWVKIFKKTASEKSEQLMVPPPSQGVFELRNAIAKHLFEFRGMDVNPEQIVIGAGTEYLYSLIILLIGRDRTYAVEDPGYSKIRQIYESNNTKCICVPMDDDGIVPDVLNISSADVIHISPSHHFPTGIVTPVSRRLELLKWSNASDGRYIIEDDYDSEFRFTGKPIPTMQSIDNNDNVIYVNTFTKSLASTIRISYMVLPKNLIDKFKNNLGFYSCTVSTFEQYTLAEFISDGYFEKHINRMRIYYRKQRNKLISLINAGPLKNEVIIYEKNSGLHFLMKVKTRHSDNELIDLAKEKGLKIRFLSQYYTDPELAISHTLVINYSTLTEEQATKSIEILTQIL